MKYTKVYDISKLEDLKASERKLNNLINKYEYVRVETIGLDKIRIVYGKEVR